MRIKYIDRAQWERVESSKSVLINTFEERFNGYASAIFVEKVREKLVCNLDERQFCLVDDGYIWIQRLPIDGLGGAGKTTVKISSGEINSWEDFNKEIDQYILRLN